MNYLRESISGLRINRLMILLWLIAIAACGSSSISSAQGRVFTSIRSALVYFARTELGTPYVWGGARPGGFDCSGLVQYSFSRVGVDVPRTAAEQRAASRPLNLRQLKPGDLVFFTTERSQSHVGIYVGRGKFIHAPRTGEDVMTSTLTSPYWRRVFARAGSFLN